MKPKNIRRITMLILPVLAVIAFAKEPTKRKPEVGDTEPPLEFTLKLDGKSVEISPDKPMTVTVGEKEITAELLVKPDRFLQLPGVSFRYPSGDGFETHDVSKGVRQWNISGKRAMLILTRSVTAVNPDELSRVTGDLLVSKFGAKNVTRTMGEISFGGTKYNSNDLEITLLDQVLVQRIVSIKSGDAVYTFILQDRPFPDGSQTEEEKKEEQLLDESFKFE